MVGKRGNLAKRILITVAIVVVAIVAAGAWYVSDYYRADDDASAEVADANGSADGVVVRTLANGGIAFVPDAPVAGLVFYPGGKVQPEAYAPLMRQCANRGILCVLIKPQFNLAILDANAADGIVGEFPEVDTWVMAGHSLGGVAGADYLSRHESEFDGMVFLAAYPTVDMAGYGGKVLSIVGTDDQVMRRDQYESAQSKLPAQAEELVIEGGNHANYGNYGQQAGDGQAAISRESQQAMTADAIADLARAA